jgi:hypothetical protein
MGHRAEPSVAVIPIWMSCSISVILYNSESRPLGVFQTADHSCLHAEYVYSNLDFPYPVFLTTYHLAFAVSPSAGNSGTGLTPGLVMRIVSRYTDPAEDNDACGRSQGHHHDR